MKKLLIFLLIALTANLYAQQTGINTKNPQVSLHIDGAKDNNVTGMPTAAQQANDMVVTPSGNVGIGTINPGYKLEIDGKLQLKDGGEVTNAVLFTNGSGLAGWYLPALYRSNINGTFEVKGFYSSGGTSPLYSGISIVLPKGKWLVNAGVTFTQGNPPNPIFQHCYLSTSTTTLQQNGFTFLSPGGPNTTYGGVIGLYANFAPNAPSYFGFVTGSTVIEVTRPTITIYLLLQNQPSMNYYFHTSNLENYFFATPID